MLLKFLGSIITDDQSLYEWLINQNKRVSTFEANSEIQTNEVLIMICAIKEGLVLAN